jgi:nucleoside 2-deoxyribosyltransferase
MWNVRTYMHGCDFGVAVFERIEHENGTPNVAFEVGYLGALIKPVCILKDRTLQTLPTDLLGSLYYEFDVENLKKSIKTALRQWVARQAFGNGGTSSLQAVARS